MAIQVLFNLMPVCLHPRSNHTSAGTLLLLTKLSPTDTASVVSVALVLPSPLTVPASVAYLSAWCDNYVTIHF